MVQAIFDSLSKGLYEYLSLQLEVASAKKLLCLYLGHRSWRVFFGGTHRWYLPNGGRLAGFPLMVHVWQRFKLFLVA